MQLFWRSTVALSLLGALAACSHSEPAPPILDSSTAGEPAIQHGDTDAAIANARTALAELESRKTDYAGAGADLIEGILNEDPRLIGSALEQLAKSLPKRIPAPEIGNER